MKYHIDACPDCGKYLYPDTIYTCPPKDTARQAFDRLYGHLYLSSADVAWHVFKSGWEACQNHLRDATKKVDAANTSAERVEKSAENKDVCPPNCGTGYCSCIECLKGGAA